MVFKVGDFVSCYNCSNRYVGHIREFDTRQGRNDIVVVEVDKPEMDTLTFNVKQLRKLKPKAPVKRGDAREVWVNMKLGKNRVTPWDNNPVPYIEYPVCSTIEWSPGNSVLFREVLPGERSITREMLVEAWEKALAPKASRCTQVCLNNLLTYLGLPDEGKSK